MLDQPLKCSVENDELVIRIGLNTLKCASENCPGFFDYHSHKNPPYIQVVDIKELALGVCEALNHEEEDGTTPIHILLDEAIIHSYHQGSLGFEV